MVNCTKDKIRFAECNDRENKNRNNSFIIYKIKKNHIMHLFDYSFRQMGK